MIKFEKNFFRNFILSLLGAIIFLGIMYPEMFTKFDEPHKKVIDIVSKDPIMDTRYGSETCPRVVVVDDDKSIIYYVDNFEIYQQLPDNGQMTVIVKEKKINGTIRQGIIIDIVTD